MGDKRRTATERHLPLKALATRQHGVVSTRQLAALGYTRSSASKANGVGRLHRVHRGVYAVGHADLDWNGRLMAAVLACSPVVASHWTAGKLWGLVGENTTFHLTAPTRRHRRPEFTIHYAALTNEDVTAAGAIPLTSLARTLLDIAADERTDRLERLIERAGKLEDGDGHGLFDLRDFESLLSRTQGHPGYTPLLRALDLYRPSPTTSRSSLERRFHGLVIRANLSAPSQNFVVGPYEIDCYWAAERFGVELDVFATHGSRLSFERDRERADDLLALDVEITRITDRRLEREPDAVMRRLGEHLARRRRERLVN